MRIILAVVAGLGAALMFAVAAFLQQRAADAMPSSLSLHPALLVRLVRQRVWLAGGLAMLCGYALQATALSFGPVALIQPLIVMELVFALPLAARVARVRPGPREWMATAAIVGGVALFITTAAPRQGTADPGTVIWIVTLVPSGVLILAVTLAARGRPGPVRAALLAFNAGVAFGLLAVLTKSAVHLGGHGASVLFSHFEPYLLVACGLTAFLFSQSAYQAAPITNSLPMFDVIETVSAVLIGATALGERLSVDVVHILAFSAGAALACVGIIVLSRSKMIRALYEHSKASTRAKSDLQAGREKDRRRTNDSDSLSLHAVEDAAPTGSLSRLRRSPRGRRPGPAARHE
jgi:drug/metabolite transporter (DMT)-like permease